MGHALDVLGKIFVSFSVLFALVLLPRLDMNTGIVNDFYINGVMVAAIGMFFVAVIKMFPE